MSINVKKRQHVVNRKYLTKWNNKNSKLFCLFEGNEIKEINAKNICVYNFFYKIDGINNMEKKSCLIIIGEGGREQLIANTNNCSTLADLCTYYSKLDLQNYSDPFLKILDFTLFCSLSKTFLDNNSNNLNLENKELLENNYREGIEDVETLVEALGFPFLNKLYTNSLKNIKLEVPNFIEFLCMQYSRTNVMKNNGEKVFEQYKIDCDKFGIRFDKFWPLLHFSVSIKTADYLLGRELHITFLKNNNRINFITGDQPVINLCVKKSFETPNNIELYYPISPKIAIIVTAEENKKNILFFERILTLDEVHAYNSLIKKASNKIFSDNIDDLKLYK